MGFHGWCLAGFTWLSVELGMQPEMCLLEAASEVLVLYHCLQLRLLCFKSQIFPVCSLPVPRAVILME